MRKFLARWKEKDKEKYSVNNMPYRVMWCPIFAMGRLVDDIFYALAWIAVLAFIISLIIANPISIAISIICFVVFIFIHHENCKHFL